MLARWAAHLRNLRDCAGQFIAKTWADHESAPEGRRGEADRIDALITAARWADYGQTEGVNAAIGAEIARRIEQGAGFDVEAALVRALRNHEIAGLFIRARARGVGRQAAYAELAEVFKVSPELIRKVIAETPRETFEAKFPQLDPDQIDALTR